MQTAHTPDPIRTETTTAVEGRLGNPQYLREIREARARIDKLYGLDISRLLIDLSDKAERTLTRLRAMGHDV